MFCRNQHARNIEETLQKDFPDLVKVIFIDDHRLEIMNHLYATASSLYLIRPDGYIGFRSKHGSYADLNNYLRKFFHHA